MNRAKMAVPILAAAGALPLGGGSAWGFSNGHADPAVPGQVRAIAVCQQQFERQRAEGVSPSGGPKAGFTPLNCNHFFGPGGQPPQ
jgi:hypothetical protein